MSEPSRIQAWDPTDPAFVADPYPTYAALREREPVFRGEEGTWVVTRFADAYAVVRDLRFSANPAHATRRPEPAPGVVSAPARSAGSNLMLFMDPPDHTRLRRLVSQAFTPRAVEDLRPRVQEIVDDLLGAVASRPRFDLVAEVALPLPVIVICELLGVPAADRDQFQGWSADATRLLDPLLDEEAYQRGAVAGLHFHQYFSELFEVRRAEPADDLLSALVQAEDAGDRLTDAELFATTILLFVAGHETTSNLLANGTLALLRHPEEYRRLVDNPGLGRAATDELLRYDSPVQVTARAALEDVEVGGHRIGQGDQVVVGLAAANRDPERFPNPDRLDLTRDGAAHHLAFSHGAHHCLGAALARLEGEIFFTTLARRFPHLSPAWDRLEYREHFVLRGLRHLALSPEAV